MLRVIHEELFLAFPQGGVACLRPPRPAYCIDPRPLGVVAELRSGCFRRPVGLASDQCVALLPLDRPESTLIEVCLVVPHDAFLHPTFLLSRRRHLPATAIVLPAAPSPVLL